VLPAVISFTFGAYRAWANEHSAFTSEVEKNAKPRLSIELVGAFFDVSKMFFTNEPLVHVYAYLKVTNLSSPETLIKNGTLVMTVGGARHKGTGDDNSVTGNAIEHVSDFRMGGEVTSPDVFGNTLSPFPRLKEAVNAEKPLRRGITVEGFVVFTFKGLMNWDKESQYVIPVTDAVFTLRDSFDGAHVLQVISLKIPQGTLTTAGAFAHKPSN
jgi:hypothetical protein